jgi:hypothetical protein
MHKFVHQYKWEKKSRVQKKKRVYELKIFKKEEVFRFYFTCKAPDKTEATCVTHKNEFSSTNLKFSGKKKKFKQQQLFQNLIEIQK